MASCAIADIVGMIVDEFTDPVKRGGVLHIGQEADAFVSDFDHQQVRG